MACVFPCLHIITELIHQECFEQQPARKGSDVTTVVIVRAARPTSLVVEQIGCC